MVEKYKDEISAKKIFDTDFIECYGTLLAKIPIGYFQYLYIIKKIKKYIL